MENQINDDIFSPEWSCIHCCDTGFYYDGSIRKYCSCVAGEDLEDSEAREDHERDFHDDYEGYSWDDDASAFASAGHGTDEDYGMIGGDSDLMGEW